MISLARLGQELRAQPPVAIRPAARWLIALTLLGWLSAGALHATGGYHTGFLWLNQATRIWPDALWANLTFMGDTLFAVVLLLPLARRCPRLLWSAILAALVCTVYVHALKNLLPMPRPPAVFATETFHSIGLAHKRGSFPSGHTATAFTMAGLMLFYLRSWPTRLALVILAALIGASRVAVGVHWPVDVLMGAAGGALSAWLGTLWAQRWTWGLRPLPHLALVGLLIACAVALFGHDGGYAAAGWLAKLTATAALLGAATEYLLRPGLRPAPVSSL